MHVSSGDVNSPLVIQYICYLEKYDYYLIIVFTGEITGLVHKYLALVFSVS